MGAQIAKHNPFPWGWMAACDFGASIGICVGIGIGKLLERYWRATGDVVGWHPSCC